ncbi:uncharacterized protein LOC131248672 [Magnolia sinica]|uniref:uncharacterized protein LOC131248672 n=1 Tax=Magnolia sinica TaxID=86752 RepID=UPI0026594EF9|nr:uncharacterized protein LOC131248672 [Magnolia sinica]
MSPLPNPISTNFCPSNSAFPPPDLILASLSLLFLFSSSFKPHLPNLKTPSHLPSSCSQTPRRLFFLKSPSLPTKITAMSKNPALQFSSPQSLSDWLKPRLPYDSLSSWGVRSGTKNIHNLWLELSEGETSLSDDSPPIRTVHVATIRIRDASGRRILIESHQELSDGSVRPRLRPLSEKMKPGEAVDDAIHRAIREELGSVVPDASSSVRIVPGSYKQKVEERPSASYPGLPACYILHSVDAWVDGLPDGEFCTEEEEYGNFGEAEFAEKAVSVRRHFWKWADDNSDGLV